MNEDGSIEVVSADGNTVNIKPADMITALLTQHNWLGDTRLDNTFIKGGKLIKVVEHTNNDKSTYIDETICDNLHDIQHFICLQYLYNYYKEK